MGGFLSTSEIESLLRGGPLKGRAPSQKQTTSEIETEIPGWVQHDFSSPPPLSEGTVEVLQAIHAGLCIRLSRQLSQHLLTSVEVRPVGMHRLSPDQLANGIATLGVTCSFGGVEAKSPILISWQDDLALVLIDRMLGGTPTLSKQQRSLGGSEIDARLLMRLSKVAFEEFQRHCSFEDSEKIEIQVVATNEMMADFCSERFPYDCFSFEIVIDSDRGLMHVCLPRSSTLELERQGQNRAVDGGISSPSLATTTRQLPLEITVDLAQIQIQSRAIGDLSVGDILMTDLEASSEATLRVGSVKLYRVSVGTLEGRSAVRLGCSVNSESAAEFEAVLSKRHGDD